MNNPEQTSPRRGLVGSRIGDMLFKFWHGYTQEESQQLEFWTSMIELLKIDGKVYDRAWTERREAELTALPSSTSLQDERWMLAYGRARLEDYCRHQGALPDGRVVARLPAYRADKGKLAQLGIAADNFNRDFAHESSDDNLTVILPAGWTLRPADVLSNNDDASPVDPLSNERWAGVYNEANVKVVSIFYNHKPFGFEDSFRSYTSVLEDSISN